MRVRTSRFESSLVALGIACIAGASGRAEAATLCVNPGGTGGCFSQIGDAVSAASNNDTIEVQAGLYGEDVHLHADDVSWRRLTIRGAGTAETRIMGVSPKADGVIEVLGRLRVEISDLSIRDFGYSGVRTFRSRVTLRNVLITGMERKGLWVEDRSRITIEGSTIEGNGSGGGRGGGIDVNRSKVTIIDSTLSGNSADLGGGISAISKSKVVLRNSTLSGNSAGQAGGGVWLMSRDDRAKLDHCTIAENSAGAEGGGIDANEGRLIVRGTLVADNTAPASADLDGTARTRGGNLIESGGSLIGSSKASDLLGVDPQLGPLQDNGGPTLTHAIASTSPAEGAIALRRSCRDPDQRGVARAAPCDIGAFELP